MDNIFELTEPMAANYQALVRYFKDETVPTKSRMGKRFSTPREIRRKNKLIRIQKCKCIDCKVPFTFSGDRFTDATAEHIIPWRYGSSLSNNCEFLCEPCNQIREYTDRTKHILRFFGSIDNMEKHRE
jgi:5-methylcytosine-specific restriction endonuclease McrA